MNNKNKNEDKRKEEIEFRIFESKGKALLDHEIMETLLSVLHDSDQIAKNLVIPTFVIGKTDGICYKLA